jgi:mRNA interferase MazF
MGKPTGGIGAGKRSGSGFRTQYQPDRGDFIYIDFSPHAGTEQGGRRPALVLSPMRYNVGVGLVIVCPITNQMKGGPFEVPVPPGLGITGVVLSDHSKTADWMVRNAEFHSKAPKALVDSVIAKIVAILEG